jgi:phospholipid/cholesterol/gamma-HCH transport system permease protein
MNNTSNPAVFVAPDAMPASSASSNVFSRAARWATSMLSELGGFTLFVGRTFQVIGTTWKRRGLLIRQCEFVGVTSLGVITVAAIFLGGVLGYQLFMSFKIFGAEALVGGTLGVTLMREMAPVFAGIMITGRTGAAMAAEIATMRISEQIDALEVMAVDPFEYLVFPRVAAGVLMGPLLAIFFGAISSLSGEAVACGMLGLDHSTFWEQYALRVDFEEMIHLLAKSTTFGFLISAIACYYGFNAQGGAGAVGKATRVTVVVSLLAILLADYFLTSMLPYRMSILKVR